MANSTNDSSECAKIMGVWLQANVPDSEIHVLGHELRESRCLDSADLDTVFPLEVVTGWSDEKQFAFTYSVAESENAGQADFLMALANDAALSTSVRGLAIERLSTLRKPDIPAEVRFADYFADPSAEIRYWACIALAVAGTEADIPALLAMQSDAEPYNSTTVGEEAAWAAEQIRLRRLARAQPEPSPADPFTSMLLANLIGEALDAGGEEFDARLRALHLRGDTETFEAAAALCQSNDPPRRSLGAAILGQLGMNERPYAKESVAILLELLANDSNEDVLASAANSFGHLTGFAQRKSVDAGLLHLLRLAVHPAAKVRLEVGFGLSSVADLQLTERMTMKAVTALTQMASDPDRDVVDWAIFRLSRRMRDRTHQDPEVVTALQLHTNNDDTEIRHQAIAGLAYAGFPGIAALVLRDLELAASGEAYNIDIILAAEHLGDSSFLPHLREIFESGHLESWHVSDLEAAITACTPRVR